MKKVKYVGKGMHLQGVPARDMTMDEWQRIPEWKREGMLAQGMYELPKKKVKKKVEPVEEPQEVTNGKYS